MTNKGFLDLPAELLDRVLSFITTARTLSRLGQTCHHFHSYIENHGWKIFLDHRFPTIPVSVFLPPRHPKPVAFDRDAVKTLTAQSRSWDRRAFLTREVMPPEKLVPRQRNYRFRRQRTMEFRPCIDSYMTINDGNWESQREVLAYGAGPQWLMRVKYSGSNTKNIQLGTKSTHIECDQHGHQSIWFVCGDKNAETSQDIVSVNLLRPEQRSTTNENVEEIITASISGKMAHYQLDLLDIHNSPRLSCRAIYLPESFGHSGTVYSTSLSKDTHPRLAAVVGRVFINLYEANLQQEPSSEHPPTVKPFLAFNAIQEINIKRSYEQIWTTSWLSSSTLAAGIGPSAEPLRLFDLSKKEPEIPIRTFPTNDEDCHLQVDGSQLNKNSKLSVYSIQPMLPELTGAGHQGEVFISGWYDGSARVHDLRDPRASVQQYYDLVDSHSAIYSLATYGRQRFVAGGARHSLIKVFDFRMAGGRAYDYLDNKPCTCSAGQHNSIQQALDIGGKVYPHVQQENKSAANYNIFCGIQKGRMSEWPRRESTVYALSSPSPMSSNLFIGLEGEVCEHSAISLAQETAHPSPVYATSPVLGPTPDPALVSQEARRWGLAWPAASLKAAWDPLDMVKSLVIYGQVEFSGLRLMRQVQPHFLFRPDPTCIFDERLEPTAGFGADGRRLFNH